MQFCKRGLVAVIATVLFVVAVPSAAQAWTVTVRIHGAGGVTEVPNRFGDDLNMTNCSIAPDGKTETSEANCVGGTANGLYNSGNIVRLAALLPTDGAAYLRGWRFSKWVDGTGSGQINCDPQETVGNQTSPTYCEFQIFENLYVDLYFTDDFGPQDTSLTGGPTGTVSSSSATFDFNAASDPEASFECRLDRPGQTGTYQACGNSLDKSETYSDLFTDGSYTFSVRGKDWEGKVDSTPVSRTWTVDRTGPTVSITGGPEDGGTTNQAQPTFTFSAGETATYECSIDGGSYAGCTSPFQPSTPLSDAPHTFAVRAYDSLNNLGTATTRSFTVDATGPTVSITDGPADGGSTNETQPTFTFSAGETATYECSIDGGAYADCTSPFQPATPLSEATHTFAVRAYDSLDNLGTATTRTFTVDQTGPTVSITDGPANGGSTNQTQPTFTFSAGETATYECSIDGGTYADCTSPFQPPTPLSEAPHTFAVRAYDSLDNLGTATTRSFTVDLTAPETTLLTGPAEGVTTPSRSTTFTFASPESAMQFECRIDDEAFAPCTSPYTRELDNGDHAFEVRAKDAAGNVDATPVRRTWRVNSLDEDADGYNRPQDCNDGDAAIHPGATDVAGNGVDEDCSGADAVVPVAPVDSDVDRDGVAVPLDCNDTNATIHPGAADAPGNGVDENCDGADAAFAIVSASLRHFWLWKGSRTWATRLRLSGVTRGAVVTFSCKGRGCPFKKRTLKPRANRSLDLARVLKKRKLRKGARLTIRVSAVGMTAKVVTFRMRRGKAPSGGKFLCQAPGAAKPGPC